MAYIDNYPNGWKNGYSSSDDPDRRLNDATYDSLRIGATKEDEIRAAREARMAEIERERERLRAKEEAEQARIEFQQSQLNKKIEQNIKLREKAVDIIMGQKRAAYDRQNILKKAVLKIQGRTFDQMKWKTITEARQRVDKMSNEEVKIFVEANERRSR